MYLSTGEYIEPKQQNIHPKNNSRNNCRLKLKGLNPHPSETFPRIKCQEYNPDYCKKKQIQICERQEPNNVMVHLGNKGNIEVSNIQGNEVVSRSYPWNRIAPLQTPLSNNITQHTIDNVWENI